MPQDFQQIRNAGDQQLQDKSRRSKGDANEGKKRTSYFVTLPTCQARRQHHRVHTFIASAIKAPSVGFPIKVLFLIKASLHTQPA